MHPRADVQARILNNARAAEWDRLKNVARQELGQLAGQDAVEIKARELLRRKLSDAGRRSQALRRQRTEAGKTAQATLDLIEAQLLALLEDIARARITRDQAAV